MNLKLLIRRSGYSVVLVALFHASHLGAAANWEIQTDCSLLSAARVISDGYQETPVRLRLDSFGLKVLTESNIDISKPDTGLAVDGGKQLPADRVEHDTNLIISGDIDRITDLFIAGNSAEVRLGFWPTWPDTGQKTVSFSLIGFTRAHRMQPGCNQPLTQTE